MSLKSRFANRHKRADWPMVKQLIIREGTAMHNTDKDPGPASQPNQPVQLVTTKMGFQHPPGFEPAAFLMIGMTKEGKAFVNMPFQQPHLCLHLATTALEHASRLAIQTLQEAHADRSLIIAPPPGLSIIQTWQGPAGRG